jgi:hypothetical protein
MVFSGCLERVRGLLGRDFDVQSLFLILLTCYEALVLAALAKWPIDPIELSLVRHVWYGIPIDQIEFPLFRHGR